jgi:hypothetical protein
MAGTGNLILKRGTVMPYDYTQDNTAGDTDTKIILKGMPAAQIVGLSEFFSSGSGLNGVAKYNYPNRLWLGMDGYGSNDIGTGAESDTTFNNTIYSTVYPYTPAMTTTTRQTRPLWMGAEIRAYYPLKEDGGANGDYVVLKADWNKPSDYVLVTQKAISAMPLRVYERKLDPTDTVAPDAAGNNREFIEFSSWANQGTLSEGSQSTFNSNLANKSVVSTRYCFPDIGTGGASTSANDNPFGTTTSYAPSNTDGGPTSMLCSIKVYDTAAAGEPPTVQLGFVSTIVAFNAYLADPAGAKVALLGSDGAAKGPQSFQSPVAIENYLDLLPYSDLSNPSYPATIKSSVATAASIFDTNVLDLTIGGEADNIKIGDTTTDGNTTTTIYGNLVVTGTTETIIDGGTF